MHENRELVTIALRRQADTIHRALRDAPLGSPTEVTVDLRGVPGMAQAQVLAARTRSGQVRLMVTHLDGTEVHDGEIPDIDLPGPSLEVESEDDNYVEGRDGIRWYPTPGGLQPEIMDVDDAGQPIVRRVDTDKYRWQMRCACGNLRFSKRSGLHQVYACRVCTKARRHAYQVAWQRRARSQK